MLAWAANEYPLLTPTKVTVKCDYDEGYSEYTPGDGYTIDVVTETAEGERRYRHFDEDEFGAFVRQVVMWAPNTTDVRVLTN